MHQVTCTYAVVLFGLEGSLDDSILAFLVSLSSGVHASARLISLKITKVNVLLRKQIIK